MNGRGEERITVNVAELKARLSEYLRRVEGGESVVVLNRRRPVARIVPFQATGALDLRGPVSLHARPASVPMPPPASLRLDVVELLLEDRREEGP